MGMMRHGDVSHSNQLIQLILLNPYPPQGGANAGHTIYDTEGNKWKLHLLPSGILNPKATCVVGNGVVVHLPSLLEEIEGMRARGVSVEGRLFISSRAHLLFDLHKEIDARREEELEGRRCCWGRRSLNGGKGWQ